MIFGSMTKSIIRKLFGIALILAVTALAAHAVTHWHAHAYDEEHCQVCHVGHAAIPQSKVAVLAQGPSPVARFISCEDSSPDLEAIRTSSSPRAPPAA
jgi:hypothetical protein